MVEDFKLIRYTYFSIDIGVNVHPLRRALQNSTYIPYKSCSVSQLDQVLLDKCFVLASEVGPVGTPTPCRLDLIEAQESQVETIKTN